MGDIPRQNACDNAPNFDRMAHHFAENGRITSTSMKHIKRYFGVIFLAILVAGTWYILSSKEFRTAEGRIFGTTYHVKYSSSKNLDAEILAALREVDDALSMFNDSSTLSRFNRGEKNLHDKCFDTVVSSALEISEETGGAFDITVAPLVNLWGFGFKHRDKVTPESVDSARQSVGFRHLSYSRQRGLERHHPGTTIDCAAIAKGYAVDHVAQTLYEKGCRNYMVEVGGEIVVRGQNAEGRRWSIGITKPVDDSTGVREQLQQTIHITDCAMATSGNYRNFYYDGQRKVSHTIDPSTGYPVAHSLLSATVIAPNCMMADAYATAFMVMGVERARHFLNSHTRLKAFLVYSDEKGALHTWQTKNFPQ